MRHGTRRDSIDALELQRIGLLFLNATEMSKDQYVLARYSEKSDEWRVSVRLKHPKSCRCISLGTCPGVIEYISSSKESLMLALDRVVEWQRQEIARLERIAPLRIGPLLL